MMTILRGYLYILFSTEWRVSIFNQTTNARTHTIVSVRVCACCVLTAKLNIYLFNSNVIVNETGGLCSAHQSTTHTIRKAIFFLNHKSLTTARMCVCYFGNNARWTNEQAQGCTYLQYTYLVRYTLISLRSHTHANKHTHAHTIHVLSFSQDNRGTYTPIHAIRVHSIHILLKFVGYYDRFKLFFNYYCIV